MKGYSTKEILGDPFFELPSDKASLEAVYRTLAKSADQRLVRLEKYKDQEDYGNAMQWAYRRAMRDIRSWGGEEATRFNIKAPDSVAGLKAKIEDIKTFLKSQSSTKKGLAQINQKRVDKINELYSTDFTVKDVKNFFESNLWKELSDDASYGSENAARVIGQIKRNKKAVVKAIEKSKKAVVQVPDKMIKSLVEKAIKAHGPELKKFLEGEALEKAKA